MWSIGCIIMELFTGSILFPGADDLETFCLIISTVGLPSSDLLSKGRDTHKYLYYRNGCWFFKGFHEPASLNCNLHQVEIPDPINAADQCDTECFMDLVSLMLEPDPADRISPEELLKHQFITMEHLDPFTDYEEQHVLECDHIMTHVLRGAHCEEQSWSEEESTGPSISPTTSTKEEQKEPSSTRKRSREEDQDYSDLEEPLVQLLFSDESPTRKRLRVDPVRRSEEFSSSIQSVLQPTDSTPRGRKRCLDEVCGSDDFSSSTESVLQPTDSLSRGKRRRLEAACASEQSEVQPIRKRHCETPLEFTDLNSYSDKWIIATSSDSAERHHNDATDLTSDSESPTTNTAARSWKRRRVESVEAPEGLTHSMAQSTDSSPSRKKRHVEPVHGPVQT
ncbi:hypothetical protein WMY93_012529 [Mugilogobius chulae]|uniref:Protein kinase domain-containing protein n=1 Tax=Mugilogobius chulae TaxID=88201 RepID=A0AAW0P5Q8_9GOBI